MRGAPRRRSDSIQIAPADFAWDRAVIATLRHSTLPWLDGLAESMELPATPLVDLGARDRLSLVAQFAAHQALLQFAGIADGEVDPAEWAVVRRRGTDTRLLRIASRTCSSDEAPPALTLIQQFAEAIGAPPTDVMRQSWARPDAVYAEIDARLRDDAAADLRWLRHAAASEILAPGVSGLRALWSERGCYSCGDPSAIDSVRAMAALDRTATLLVLGEHASPLRRYSALSDLAALAGSLESLSESEVAERVIATLANKVVVLAIVHSETFDSGSRRVVELLSRADAASWLLPADFADALSLPDARHFVIAPQLPARRAIGERLVQLPAPARRAWLEDFVQSPQFAAYLDDAVLPQESAPQTLALLSEPRRSYIAALALLGKRVPGELALRFLSEFLFHGSLEELLVDGVSTLDDDSYSFCNEHVRAQAASLIPASSRAALCEVAAGLAEESGDFRGAALLLLDAGERERAIGLLERVQWSSAEECVRTLRNVSGLSSRLAQSLGDALVDCGRYRDARELAPRLADADRELLLARTERRCGDYAPALARLERLANRGFEAELLRGELLYLHGRDEESAHAFAAAVPLNRAQQVRLDYAQGVLAVEAGQPFDWSHGDDYLGARLATYDALGTRDFERALAAAEESFARAMTLPERIDAALDRTFVLFTAGRWNETRAAAMDALSLVEETQGDRAAGGILFTLAYLAADDGQWAHASRRIHRLRHFYSGTHDERRLAELDLLAAHLDFSRGRFAESRGAAVSAANGRLPEQIREAARLILDELDAIEGRTGNLRSTGATSNIELTDRHRLLRTRRGEETVAIVDPFTRALAEWRSGDPPNATTRSEQLKLFRIALTMRRADVTESIARALGIELAPVTDTSDDVRILRAAALAEFPYAPHALNGARWSFASRNRLGHWTVMGSETPSGTAASEELDRILVAGANDWIVCSDRELLHVESLSRWPHESRDALAAIVRIHAEHHRLRRVVEQEEGARISTRADAVDGIVGDSAPMREIFARIARVARRDVAVCILGESGTGKELVARALHRHSPRRSKSFTAVNCAALPENLIESELFGHVRGAFTGADRDRAGLIETSDGGTLFLDEIGEMPLAAQASSCAFCRKGNSVALATRPIAPPTCAS